MASNLLSNTDLAQNTEPNPTTSKVRIHFIDGLRGLAAIYVLIYHASISIYVPGLFGGAKLTGSFLDKILDLLLLILQSFQHYAVVLFIVISGYSLMLSVVRSKEGNLPEGFLSFMKRRGLRLLPTYFTALILSITIVAMVSTPLPTPENIITHIFLVHNWFSNSIYTLDGPMWSLAVEWQIYFLFPILLIPLWRWLGSVAVVLIGIVLGLIIQFSFDSSQTIIFAWFIGLFALGMFAASIGFPRRQSEVYLKKNVPWGILTLLFFLSWFAIRFVTKSNDFERDINWYKDTIMGLAFCCLLVYLTKIQTNFASNPRSNIVFWLIASKWLVFLGSFSYSIYLFHAPILSLFDFILEQLALPQLLSWTLIILLGVPIVLFITYLLYTLFERPFVNLLSRSLLPDTFKLAVVKRDKSRR